MTAKTKTPNPNTCATTGTEFEAFTTFISEWTGYRKCDLCGKSVASLKGKVRWHTK